MMPLTPTEDVISGVTLSRTPSQDRRQNEKEDREMFSKLEKPRVRYDVEVITKLIVYSGRFGCQTNNVVANRMIVGIAWIAVEGAPLLFQAVGLGIYDSSG